MKNNYKAGKPIGGIREYDIINDIESRGWKVLVDWKSESSGKLRFDVVDDSYDRKFIKNIDLESFLKSLIREEKLNMLGI